MNSVYIEKMQLKFSKRGLDRSKLVDAFNQMRVNLFIDYHMHDKPLNVFVTVYDVNDFTKFMKKIEGYGFKYKAYTIHV